MKIAPQFCVFVTPKSNYFPTSPDDDAFAIGVLDTVNVLIGAGAIKELEPGEVLTTEEGVTEIAAGVRRDVSDTEAVKLTME